MILMGLFVAACTADGVAHPQPHFTCRMAATSNGWCQVCRVGYIATVEIKSAQLFEALDAYGHDIPDPRAMDCVVCRDAFLTDGYCPDCRIGFVDGHAYFTKLTYLLARGEVRDPAKVTCGVCAKADRWCDACGRGMVGNVAFREKKVYAAARKQFELLRRAVKESERCEMCSMLLFYGGVCSACKITYRNGKVVEPKPAGEK
jgi:hypothetical protein